MFYCESCVKQFFNLLSGLFCKTDCADTVEVTNEKDQAEWEL